MTTALARMNVTAVDFFQIGSLYFEKGGVPGNEGVCSVIKSLEENKLWNDIPAVVDVRGVAPSVCSTATASLSGVVTAGDIMIAPRDATVTCLCWPRPCFREELAVRRHIDHTRRHLQSHT